MNFSKVSNYVRRYVKVKKSNTVYDAQMDKVDIVLHIGLPKTGSSAIQKFCLDNSSWLSENGYYYPHHDVDKNGVSGGHSDLYSLIDDKNVEGATKLITKHLDEAKKLKKVLLLSSEACHLFYSEYKEIFAELNVYVIGFFRDPVETLFSAYNQMVKRHYCRESLFDYAQNSLKAEKPILAGKTVLGWKECFKERFVALPYSNEVTGCDSVTHLFLATLGLRLDDIDKKVQNTKTNRSYGLSFLELKRLINNVLSDTDKKLNEEIDLLFQKISDQNLFTYQPAEASLPKDLIQLLVDKFSNQTALIEKLHDTKFSSQHFKTLEGNFSEFDLLKEMMDVVKYLQKQKPAMYHEIRNKIYSKNWGVLKAEQVKLLNLFDISTHEVSCFQDNDFSDSIVRKLTTYSQFEFIREFAKLYRDRGDYIRAKTLVDKALELRPKGPIIKKLYDEITSEYEKLKRK